jgi:hypothetical protein
MHGVIFPGERNLQLAEFLDPAPASSPHERSEMRVMRGAWLIRATVVAAYGPGFRFAHPGYCPYSRAVSYSGA